MNISNILKSDKFSKKDQFKKRKFLEEYLLTDKNCIVGSKVLCFEKESYIARNPVYYSQFSKNKLLDSLTIGNYYEIKDHKIGKIKVIDDFGKAKYYSIDRFLYSLKIERKEKLENLKNLNNKDFNIKEGFELAEEQLKSKFLDFITWIATNKYEHHSGDRWCKKYMSMTISAEELLELWLKSITNKF